jgi:hypothetical protein
MSSEHKYSECYYKRVRKVMTVEQKINILDKLECGESVAAVEWHFHITESPVRTIK